MRWDAGYPGDTYAAIATLPQAAEAAYPERGADFAEAMEVTCPTP